MCGTKSPEFICHVTGARCSAPPGRSTQTTRDVLRKRPRPWIKPRAWALHFIPSRFIPSPSTRQARSQRLPGGRCERWAHEESAGYRAPFRTSGRQQDTVRAQPCRHLFAFGSITASIPPTARATLSSSPSLNSRPSMIRQGSRAKTEQAEMEEDGDRPSARVGRIGLAPSARRRHARSCTHSRCTSSPRRSLAPRCGDREARHPSTMAPR